MVWIPPGQKHWHGAAPNSLMAHIGVVEHLDSKSVEWMEKVSYAQYGVPLRAQAAGKVNKQPRPCQAAIGDFAPKLADVTDNVLYGDIWRHAVYTSQVFRRTLADSSHLFHSSKRTASQADGYQSLAWCCPRIGALEAARDNAWLRRHQRIVNVTTPTLIAYFPGLSKATGTAVIIARGGGFVFLGIHSEQNGLRPAVLQQSF